MFPLFTPRRNIAHGTQKNRRFPSYTRFHRQLMTNILIYRIDLGFGLQPGCQTFKNTRHLGEVLTMIFISLLYAGNHTSATIISLCATLTSINSLGAPTQLQNNFLLNLNFVFLSHALRQSMPASTLRGDQRDWGAAQKVISNRCLLLRKRACEGFTAHFQID